MGITSATPHKPGKAQNGAAGRAKGGNRSGAEAPRSGRQRQVTASTGAQRERILQAAAGLFARQGYANTTMAQIVRELGVTKPFVYYYFQDKQEIFETLSWRPTVDCFTALDFAATDPRPAAAKVIAGLEALIRATIAHYPVAFFPYREPQVYRPEYLAASRKLAQHFHGLLCPLLEQGRRDGALDFEETRITALAACSLPGFLYSWYRPDGRLSPDEVVAQLTRLAARVIGLRGPVP